MAGAAGVPVRKEAGVRRAWPAGAQRLPLHDSCPRWQGQPDDWLASMEETADQTERRRSAWPCSKLLDLLSPDLTRIGR